MKDEIVSTRIEGELLEEFEKERKKTSRSVSEHLREILEDRYEEDRLVNLEEQIMLLDNRLDKLDDIQEDLESIRSRV